MAHLERPKGKKTMTQKSIPHPRKTFVNPLNKQLGRRTGRNFRAGRKIRVGKDGLENFDDYLSESDADSICLSDIQDHSERTKSVDKENETTNIQFNSVPVPDKSSMAGNSTVDNTALTQNSQVSLTKHSRFDWLRNRNIGRRTGKDMRANKQIRVDKNGMENFDDYLSESDAESFLSGSSCKRRTSEKIPLQRRTLDSADQSESNGVYGEKSLENGGFHNHDEEAQAVNHSQIVDSNDIHTGEKSMKKSGYGNVKSSTLSCGFIASRNDNEYTEEVIYTESPSNRNGCKNNSSKIDERGRDEDFVKEMVSDRTSITRDEIQTRKEVVEKSHKNRRDHKDRKDEKYREDDVDDAQVNENSSEINDGNDIVNDGEDVIDDDRDNLDNGGDVVVDGEDDLDDDGEDESNCEGDENPRSVGQSESDELESEHGDDSEDEDIIDNDGRDDDDHDKEDVLKNSKLTQHKRTHSGTKGSNSGNGKPEESDILSDKHLAVNDRNSEEQALSGLDVAGNKSGSITKRGDPGTAVSFNRTKKRLSYSALEASAETKKAREMRVERANSELANQRCSDMTLKQSPLSGQLPFKTKPTNLPHKFVDVEKEGEATKNVDEDNFLCLSTRSAHTAHLRHPELSDEEDSDICIADDTRKHFMKKRSLTATKTKKTLNKDRGENVSKSVGKLKESDSYLKRKQSKQSRKSVTKQLQKVKTVTEKQEKSSGSRSKHKTRNQTISKKDLNEVDNSDDNELNDVENQFSMSEQEGSDKQLHTETKQKYKSRKKDNPLDKNTKKVSKTVQNKNTQDLPLQDTTKRRVSQTVSKNLVSVKRNTTEKRQIEGSPKKGSMKRKSSSEENTDIETNKDTVVSKKKKVAKRSAKKYDIQGSNDNNVSIQCDSPTEVPVQTPDPESRLVSAGLDSGKSFRVSRRSEILENITSGPLNRGTEVKLEPNDGLTPCITKKNQPRKSKGRRVTICPEENRHHQLSDDEENLTQKSAPNKFRHSMGLSDDGTPLPSPSTTPVHIFEYTRSDTPTSISKLPRCYSELPVEDRCIRPEPAPDGLRRSQRVRLKPIAQYKNEEIIWETKPDIGRVIVGVKPSMETVYLKKEEIRRKKRQLKNALLKATKGKTKKPHRKLSIHMKLPDDFCPVEHHDIPVIDPDTQEENGIECFAHRDSVKAIGPTGESPKSTDPFYVTKLLDQPCMSAGTLSIMALATKPESRVSEQALLFRISEGKLLVKIHNTSALLETDDAFFVPYGNTYSITNLRNDKAELFYTVHKFIDISQSSIVK